MQLRSPTSDEERGRSPQIIRAFLSALIEVATPQGVWTVTPDSRGRPQPEGFPTGVQQLAIITAHNPGGVERPGHINDAAQAALSAKLRIGSITAWPAMGRSPSRDWGEQSLALVDTQLDDCVEMNRNYEQAALFFWTPGVLSVVWTPPTGVVTADMRFAQAVLQPREA